MTTLKYHCPYCNQDISLQHYLEHLINRHEADIFDIVKLKDNIQRLKMQSASINFPLQLRLVDKLSSDNYFACLGCMRCCKKRNSALRHLSTCYEAHKKKCKELYDKYPLSELKDKTDGSPIILEQVVQGWTDDQVNALIGSMMACITNLELDCYENSKKVEYYEDKMKDLELSEEVQDEIDESVNGIDTEDCSVKRPEDVTQLYNLSRKIGFPINNEAILEAYKKWDKMPLKKLTKK